MTSVTPLIRAEGLTKVHKDADDGRPPVAALRGVSLTVHRRDFVAITGRSGSGKTTLLTLLGGLDRPTDGRYLFDGDDVSGLSDGALARLRNRQIGFVFQHFNLLPRLTVRENVTLPLLYGAGGPGGDRAADALLDRLGVGPLADAYPNRLSGGEQQRVAIARALIGRPSLILADEPTGCLDEATGEEILALFDDLRQEGVAIVLVTHDVDLVARHADRMIALRDGRVADDSARRPGPAVDDFSAARA